MVHDSKSVTFSTRASHAGAGRTLKIDKALLYVDADEFDSEAIANVESMSTFDQLSLDGRLEHSNPGALFRRPGHQGVEDLPDTPREK